MLNLMKNYTEKNTKLQKLRLALFPLIKYPEMMLESEITEWRILEIVNFKPKKPESCFPVFEMIWHKKTSKFLFSVISASSSPESHRTCKFISPRVKI